MFPNNNAVVIQRPAESSEEMDPMLLQKMGKRAFKAMLAPILADDQNLKHTLEGDKKLYTMYDFKVIHEKDRYVMKAKAEPENVHALMWQIARNGHKEGELTGSLDFKRQAWLYGTYYGMTMQGYLPTTNDQIALKFLRDQTPAVVLSKDRSKETTAPDKPAASITPEPAKAASKPEPDKAASKPEPDKEKPTPSRKARTRKPTAKPEPDKDLQRRKLIELALEDLRREPAAFKFLMEQLNQLKEKVVETEHRKQLNSRLREFLTPEKVTTARTLLQELSKDYKGSIAVIRDIQSKVKSEQAKPVKSAGPGM